MEWEYQYPSKKAIHIPTNCIFNIDHSSADVAISLADGAPKGAESQVLLLLSELKVVIRDGELKVLMRGLLERVFGGDFTAAAYILKDLTGRNVSERTLQSWVAQTGKRSSRRCPEWAVNALQAYAEKNPEMREVYQARRERKQRDEFEHGINSLERARTTDGLEKIERDLAFDERFKARVTSAPFSDLPNTLSEILLKHERDIRIASSLLFKIYHEIQKAASLDDLKRDLSKEFDKVIDLDSFLQRGKRQLINAEEEFANEHGLLGGNV